MAENREVRYQKGDIIVREGDYGTAIYKIISGSADVIARYGTEDEKKLAQLLPGEYFGEMAVIEIARRSATVAAAEDETIVAVVDATDLSGYLSENRGEINTIARHLSHRLRALTVEYSEVCNTLRELGRLDTSVDQVNQSLLTRIRRFAKAFLLGQAAGEELAEPELHSAAQRFDGQLALNSREYRKGDVIFRQGADSDCMYHICEGLVGIYTDYGTEKQKLLSELTPEMFFGEMGLFEGLQRTATAVALMDDTCVEPVFETDLDVIMEKSPAMALGVLQHLSSRLRKLTTDYLKACKTLAEAEKDLEERKMLMSAEMQARVEYMTQLLLAPEVLF